MITIIKNIVICNTLMSNDYIIDLDASSTSDSDAVDISSDSSSDSSSDIVIRHRRSGGGKRSKIIESSSDTDSSIPCRRAGGGKRPKIVESSSDDERDDYELRPRSNSLSFKPGTFAKRRTIRDIHYSSDEDDASALRVRDERVGHVASDFQEKMRIYRNAFPDLYKALDAESYRKTLVEIEKLPNSAVICTLEIFKVAEVCQDLGIKLIALDVQYDEKRVYRPNFDYSRSRTCHPEIKQMVKEYADKLKHVFTDDENEAKLGIILTEPRYRHAMVMFKDNNDKFVLVDSNKIFTERTGYSNMINNVLEILTRGFGYTNKMELRSTNIQEFQRESREWQLSPYGLCHAFSTMTAVLLARYNLDFSQVLRLLHDPHFETITYTATVFMCSCVNHFLGSKWKLLKKITNGESASAGGPTQRSNSLTGFTNVINFYDKEYDNQQAVAFCIYKGHCEPFLPTLLQDRNKDIFTPERWRVLEHEHSGSKDLGKRTRVSTIAQLLPFDTQGKQYKVTVRYGYKANSLGHWNPFHYMRVNSNDDPFKRMGHYGRSIVNPDVNCIEIMSWVETLQNTDSGYKTSNVLRMSNTDIVAHIMDDIMNQTCYNRKINRGLYSIWVEQSNSYKVKFSKKQINETMVKIGSCDIAVQKTTKTSRTYASDVIPRFVLQFMMHKWKPAITIYLLKERRFNARQIMLLLF